MKVIVPKDNVNDEEVIVLQINFKSSEKVQKGDHILDLETSKTAISIDAPCDGYLDLKVSEGEEILVGSLLFEVLDQIDSADQQKSSSSANENSQTKYIFTKDAKIKIDELGLKEYSFKNKMVTLDDVLSMVRENQSVKATTTNDSKKIEERKVGISDNQTISANLLPKMSFEHKKHTLRKRSEIKNLSLNGNLATQSVIGVTINTLAKRSYSVPFLFKDSISDLITYEGSKLFKEFPELNSFYINEKEYGTYNEINAGFSFDNSSNLKVLSIQNADKLSLQETQSEILRLLELYESNNSIDEATLMSSTFTISDLSNSGACYMQPLVSNNHSSIIGIIKINTSFQVFVGFDHKVTSGLYVSKFLERLKLNIESHFYNEDTINYLKCGKCEMSGVEAKELGNSGFIKILGFDGIEKHICENCFNGY
jgi:pyruvate/2-oxoglutarate dehydrogenase complex dihydrolipoamide acyltransferase (E2) component